MSKKTAKQEKPLREKSQVIDDLDQLSQEIPRDDQALKDGSAKLKRLEKALKDKRAEVQRQGEETQQQVEALEEDYRHYSEQNKGLQAEKLEMQKQALAEMVSSAKESVDQAQSKVEKETQAYDEINQRVKSLKNDRFLLKEFKELEKRKAVVELLKGGTDESELDEEQQEIVEEIREGRLNLVGKRIPLKGEITELDLDLYILDKTSELDQQISGAGKNKKELERLFGNLQDKVEGQNPTPDKFLSNLVSYSTRQGEILKAIQAHGQEIESDDIEKVLDSYLKLDSVKNNGEAVGLAETLREQAQGKELTLDGFLPDLIDENEKRKETLKAIQAHGQEIDSDDIGEVLDSYLESDLVIDKEVVENLVESIKGLVKASYLTPEKLLSQDIQVAEQQKQEKSDELGALEQQVREKEQEFRQVQEAAKKWDAPYDVELEPDVQRRLDTRVRILQQKQDQARQELVAVEIDGLETNKQLALELHRLEKQVDEQRKLVKSQSDKVDQNNVKFHELTEERAQIEKDAIAKKKAVKKETGEPEQEFYLSDSPQYLRLQETIKHNKEINALKREHQLAMSSQSEELERLRAENLKLQQAQEQMQREKELREQSGVSVAEPTVEKAPKGISLFDDMMESSLEQQQSRVSGGGKSLLDELSDLPPEQLVGTVFEEEVRQARATRPEEILRLQARLAELELAQEEFTRTKENLKEIEHERDELRLEVAKEKSAKQEVEHDREEELDQLRETLEQRESALEVQTREKEKLAREISEERDAHRQELSKLEQSKNLELGTLRSQLEQAAKPSETLKAVKVENEKLKAEVRRLNLDVERYQSQGQRIKDLERQLAVLKSQVEQANIEKAAKQKELELAQAELRSTKEKGDDLASKLELAQES
ncbi:MAG: hypothetical protein J0L79_00585, partial [Rickettsiales bacterium]|nr:hypothetical protein [Rickettsiales bacterium]